MGEMPRTSHERRTDVLVLTVIPAELEAARRAFDIADTDRNKVADGTVYFHTVVPSVLAATEYKVSLLCIGSAGNPEAAAVTSAALASQKPRAALLMGIAAGMRDKVQIGDVVLSERVVAYEPAALVTDGTTTTEQPRPDIERPSHAMIQDMVAYNPAGDRLQQAFARSGGYVPTAPPGQEVEYATHVATAVAVRRSTIASGEKLLRDPSKLRRIRTLHGKVEVGEMEAAGFVSACRVGDVPWMVVRGISDFGDELKNDRFHSFAACAAAAVTRDFIGHGLELAGTNPAATLSGVPDDLIAVLADQYPEARDARAVWVRAGGRAGDVEQVNRPRDLWQRLWLAAVNGANVRPAALLDAVLEDLPNNEVVAAYRRRSNG